MSNTKFKDVPKNRTQFINLMNYIQNLLDFNKLEEDNMMETYFGAMSYYGEICGNNKYSELYDDDIQLMLSLRNMDLTTFELAEMHSLSIKAIHPKMYKLITKGYLSSYKSKKVTYYKLTPYGNKLLIDQILLK